MAQYTNKAGLPEPLFLALKGGDHKRKSDFGVTELGLAPRQLALRRRHDAEIVVDVTARVWSLAGQAMHNVIERFAKHDKNGIAEQYLTITAEGPKRPVKIGGMVDYISEDADGKLNIIDWKFVSVYSFMFEKENGGVKPEYEAQLNVYDYMLFKNGMSAAALQLGFIFRDWKQGELAKSISLGKSDYPACQIVMIPVKKWSREQQEKYVNERVALHQGSEDQPDDALPECTPEERWERGECWAVMRKGRASALKLFYSPEEAVAFAGVDPALSVIHRKGKSQKCLLYCDVKNWCSWYKANEQELLSA